MAFINKIRLRKFEFKYFKLSHSIDNQQPGYMATQVHNPSTNQDVTKFIQGFDAIEGQVIDAEWYDRKDDSGHRYVGYMLTVIVDDETIHLDFPYGKPAYRVLTRCGKNVDWTMPVTFSAWQSTTPGGKPTTAVCFSQGKTADGKNNVVKWAYTKDNPNGCPSPEEGVKGLNWDNVERWLKTQFDATVIPAIKAAGAKHVRPIDMLDGAMEFAKRKAAGAGVSDPYGDMQMPETVPEDIDADSIPF